MPAPRRPTALEYCQRRISECVATDASRRHLLGLLYILAVALIWISASFLVQALVSSDHGHAPMHPFVLSYICSSTFLLYLPIAAWRHKAWCGLGSGWSARLRGRRCTCASVSRRQQPSVQPQHSLSVPTACSRIRRTGQPHRFDSTPDTSATELDAKGGFVATPCPALSRDLGTCAPAARAPALVAAHSSTLDARAPALGVSSGLDLPGSSDRMALLGADPQEPDRWRVARAALCVAPLWFLAQLSFNYSLLFTSVTSNTVLSSPASLFTFLLSVLVLGERYTSVKLLSVLLTIAGAKGLGSS